MELYSNAMDNAYNLITGRMKLEELFVDFKDDEDEEDDLLPLPFNPFMVGKYSDDTIDLVIEHFIGLEEYEKCAELVAIKERNAKKYS
jgi:hypothetical protein